MDTELKWKIFYYGREEYYQTMQNYAMDGAKKYPNDLSFKVFSGFSLVLSCRFQEAIRELESLQSMRDMNVGAILALIFAHKSCQTVDKESVTMLEEKLKVERKNATTSALYHAALFLFFQRKFHKSRDYLEKGLKQNSEYLDGICLKGWLELMGDKSSKFKTASTCFKTVLEKDKRNIDAMLGLAKVKELEQQFPEALAQVTQIIVKVPSSLPPLIEKMKLQLCLQDWDQVLETCTRILSNDGSCIEALKMKSLIVICRDGNFSEGAICLRRLYGEVERNEPKNSKMYMDIAQMFSLVCCRNSSILMETQRFAEKAAQLEASNPDFMAELGHQSLLQGKLKEAQRYFKNTTKLDDSSIIGLTGLTLCQMMESVNEQVKQQVEFLREVQSEEPSSYLLFMSAKLCFTAEDALQALQKIVEHQVEKAESQPFGTKYIQNLNLDLMMLTVKENMMWANKCSPELLKPLMENCLVALEKVIVAAPGLLEPNFELARVHYLLGHLKEARDVLTHILDDLDASLGDAHVLMAQIYLKEEKYSAASRSLEIALSYNFQIREHPLYHLAAAMVAKESGDTAEVIKSLKSAMASPMFKNYIKEGSGLTELSLTDKASIYLELVRAYTVGHRQEEADQLMKEMIALFKGTSEEGRIFVANAELLIERGQVNAAIEALQKIQPGEAYFVLAKRTLANVYLKNKRNREAYAQCYLELANVSPSRETYEMLGDAYTSIQEPDSAIEAYEEALKLDGKDGKLICKMGKALVKTHHFTKAVNYYKEAVKNDENAELVYDMAELYFKLGQLDNAERILIKHVDNRSIDPTDISQLTARSKLLQLLAKVRDKSGSLTDSLSSLKEAKENQCKIDKRTLMQSDEHKGIVVQICVDIAHLLTRLRDFSGAIKSFKEALTFRPNDTKVLVGLARLYMQTNNMEECQITCQHLLASDPDSEPATVMLADLAFSRVDFETAAHYFKQLLTRKPDYWTALARLIEVMRRIGKLEEVQPFLERAEAHSFQAHQEAGLYFCKGLYDWYSGESQKALTHFNRSRTDNEWGEQAIYNMIEICLNPDNDILGGESFSYDSDDTEIPDSHENALKTANRLLMELKPKRNSEEAFKHRLLENFWLLATRQKSNIEQALNDLIQIATDEYSKEHVGVGLGIATAYMLQVCEVELWFQKQSQKARNHLKRMVKTQWRFEDAEYLERSWLLLTDIYIHSSKTDLAADLIQRILEHNKSCYKAYEYAGYIAEKEQLYKEAAFQYENAWRYNGKSNPAIGYKLAFNYMKGKLFADAIDVCLAVLQINPSYPRIQKEVLEKSRNNLRT